MVNRLSALIGGYVHKYQVGFIPGRQGLDQIHRTVDVISLLRAYWGGGKHQEGFLLLFDLQKAFDMVEWPYLFEVLERWGFGLHFILVLREL